MKYLVSQVEAWGEELDALPAPDPGRRKVGKRAAVQLLARKLQAAARRGFSTAELLEVLAAKGLKVHVDTLRDALRSAGRTGTTPAPKGRRRSGEATASGSEEGRAGASGDEQDASAGHEPETAPATSPTRGGPSADRRPSEELLRRAEGRDAAPVAGAVAVAVEKTESPGQPLGARRGVGTAVPAAPSSNGSGKTPDGGAGRGGAGGGVPSRGAGGEEGGGPAAGRGSFSPRADSEEI
jgi:hypothetical protein